MKKKYKTSLSPLQQKRLYRFSFLLVILFLLLVFFLPGKGLFFLRQQKRKIEAINAEKQRMEEQNAELEKEVTRLKTDMRYLEDVARRQHGLLRKEEQVFEFSPHQKKKKE